MASVINVIHSKNTLHLLSKPISEKSVKSSFSGISLSRFAVHKLSASNLIGNKVIFASKALETANDGTPSTSEIVPDTEISITKTSFGTIGLFVGLLLLSYGFGAYFNFLPGTDISPIMLTYGFPLALIGFALKYAELKPVPCISYVDAVALRDEQATPILLQVRSDVTRFRYGDEQHLEEALKRIFRYGQGGGIQKKNAPQLESIAEEVYDGRYSLNMIFTAERLTISDFIDREAKFTSFFGPGITAIASEKDGKFEVRLVSNPK